MSNSSCIDVDPTALQQSGNNPIQSTDEATLVDQLIWDGFIPVQFVLAECDTTCAKTPDPAFVFLSRMSYLITAIDAIEYLRSNAVLISETDVWFEASGMPLKSNLAIGILYDIFTQSKTLDASPQLPWIVTVHFQSFPADILLRCNSLEAAERYYMHSLKQALFLLHGSTRAFNGMSIEDQKQLWESVWQGGPRQGFMDVALKLKPIKADCRTLPIRIFAINRALLTENQSPEEGGIVKRKSFPDALQRPVTDTTLSLIQVIRACLPHDLLSFKEDTDVRAIIAGIEVNHSAPIFDLWNMFAHADLFLYIVVVV